MANYDVESHTQSHTYVQENVFCFFFGTLCVIRSGLDVRPVMKRLFFPWETKAKKARFARAPRDYPKYSGRCSVIFPTFSNFSDIKVPNWWTVPV